MHNQRQSAIRIKHHIILRAELRFRKSFKDILQLGNPLLHELPSLLQIYRLPLMHRHPSPSPSSSPTTKRSNPSNSTPNRAKIKRSIKSKNTQRSKQSIGRMRKLTWRKTQTLTLENLEESKEEEESALWEERRALVKGRGDVSPVNIKEKKKFLIYKTFFFSILTSIFYLKKIYIVFLKTKFKFKYF